MEHSMIFFKLHVLIESCHFVTEFSVTNQGTNKGTELDYLTVVESRTKKSATKSLLIQLEVKIRLKARY